jgi:hypothetical protein
MIYGKIKAMLGKNQEITLQLYAMSNGVMNYFHDYAPDCDR